MKIKKIIEICKRRKRIYLYDRDECQWLGDGAAVYPLYGLPRFDKDTLYETYDITDKQAANLLFFQRDATSTGVRFEDATADELPIEGNYYDLVHGDKIVRGFLTSQGIAFVDTKYLAPFADIDSSGISLCERYGVNKQLYFAVKMGLVLIGIIMPMNIVDEELIQRLEELLVLCKIELFNKQSAPQENTWVDEQLSAFDDDNETDK